MLAFSSHQGYYFFTLIYYFLIFRILYMYNIIVLTLYPQAHPYPLLASCSYYPLLPLPLPFLFSLLLPLILIILFLSPSSLKTH